MMLHFASSNATTLPRAHADSIPFSSNKIPEILSRLSVPAGSPTTADIRYTLAECEASPTPGVAAQTCVTSFESMIDFAASNLDTRNIRALATRLNKEDGVTPRQTYMVESVRPMLVASHDKVACHKVPYPYSIFACRTTTAELYTVTLSGTDGTKVEALTACHSDVTPTFFDEKISGASGDVPVAAVIPLSFAHREGWVGSVLFHKNDLYLGSKMMLHFASSNATTLPRAHADSIPFSSNKIPEILSRLSVPAGSPTAADIRYTLAECEASPTPGVAAQTCVTSFESMIDFAASNLGTRNIRALATRLNKEDGVTPRQSYMVESVRPISVASHDKVACHKVPYPYSIFACHTTTAELYTVTLSGTDGTKVEALTACHSDVTPTFFDEKISGASGDVPVCHFWSQEGRLWVRK
ncbi:hypothetical protein EJB05_08787, partial [Eragrostis curvula]